MWFISYNEAVSMLMEWVKTFPEHYDIIIAIPRSGLIFGGIVANKLGIPLTTPDMFLKNEYWSSKQWDNNYTFKKALVFDDSITRVSGTMHGEMIKLKGGRSDVQYVRAAMFVTEETKGYPELYCKVLPFCPHFFEWNLLHLKMGKRQYPPIDMDGVLCEECPAGVDADETKYIEWVQNAKPYLIPKWTIPYIISGRLEKYRPQTEKWLKDHNVKYDKLILWNLSDKSQRTHHGVHKAEVLNGLNPKPLWYVESLWNEAEVIYIKTKIPVLSVDKMIMIGQVMERNI
jgi:orotate phosphoribosyltransferase